MIRKSITLIFVILMMSSLFVITDQASVTSTQNITTEKMNTVSETDLGRVDWITNVAPNSDFETWNSPKNPDNVYTTRTVEESTWIETTIVSEGTNSLGMEGKALDASNYAEVRLTQQSWIYWDNPINTTLDLDWYLDEIGNPNNVDYFRIQVRMSNRNMYYYLGCDTGAQWIPGTIFIEMSQAITSMSLVKYPHGLIWSIFGFALPQTSIHVCFWMISIW